MNFLGKKIQVVSSPNKTLVGLQGIVEDETKYTFVINGKRVQKHKNVFLIDNQNIEGDAIVHRPTERLKKWK